jgi:hypothetical protein
MDLIKAWTGIPKWENFILREVAILAGSDYRKVGH